jgi:hypothetical protein
MKILNKLRKRKKFENTDNLEKDYEKNIKNLKKKLNIRLFSGILGTIVILIFMFTTMSIRYINKTLEDNFLIRLERSREERKKSIKDYYTALEIEMRREIKRNKKVFLKENLINYRNIGIDELALFDSDYKVIYTSSKKDLLPIKKEIKAIKFKKPFYVEKIKIHNDISYQHLYYKIFNPDGNEEILYFKLNNSYLNKILTVSPFKADILNDEFYITASNRKLQSTEYVIDDISKKILDGRVGIDEYKGKLYSYTYINIGENPIYLKVYEDISVYKAPLFRYITKIKLLWIISFIVAFSIIYFIGLSLESYVKGIIRISIEKEGDKKYKFLKRELVDVFEELNSVEKSLGEFKSFIKKLDLIKERIVNQNTNSINNIQENQKILKKIETDEELKEQIKEKI